MRRFLSSCLFVLLSLRAAAAPSGYGRVSGGFQSDVLWARDGFYANNYLKLDYVLGRFSAGIQAEYYPSPLPGYGQDLKGIGLPGKYLAWNDTLWSLTAGDFYDQFGTGVLFRSWEDRNLGWNNSLGGGRLAFHTPDNLLSVKVMGGWRRRGLWYGEIPLAGMETGLHWKGFTIQGSGLYRGDTWGWSALAGWEHEGFTTRAEWVGRRGGANAQTLEAGFASGKWSSTLTIRRLRKMTDPLGLNYLPSLSMQQSYMLAALNPYTPYTEGELGAAADFYYRLKTWRFHVNGTMIYALPEALPHQDVLRMAYRELNVKAENRWSRRIKTVVFVSIQELSPSHGDLRATEFQNVFVLDGLFRLTDRLSLKTCLQYLYSQELTRDWMGAVLELTSTDGWGVHVQDMYNHGSTKEHYYEAGLSWTRGAFKAALSYGRQRAGLICSGGVCRWQPEYTGGLLRLQYNF